MYTGFKNVKEFGPESEYEFEEEIEYVTLDLGNTEPSLVPNSATYRLIGLDSATPFLQLSGTIFKGRHDRLLGSEIIFRDSDGDGTQAKKGIVPVSVTEKRICFAEVRLKPKPDSISKTKGKKQEREHASTDRMNTGE